MRLHRFGLCLLSTSAGVLLVTGLFSLVAVASAAPATAPVSDRSYPGAAPCATTLQACINGSNGGDVIHIAAGAFTESFTLSKAVSLVGAGMELTVLRAAPGQRVFSLTYTTTQPVLIADLTIAGGDLSAVAYPFNQGGGALLRHDLAPVTFDSVTFMNNRARDGAGLYSEYNSYLTLTNTRFISNTAARIGGGLGATFDVTLTVTNSQFLGNVAGSGGGLYNLGRTTLNGANFVNNTAIGGPVVAYGGGAVTGPGQVIASRFEGNHNPGGHGGGLWTASNWIADTTFLSNTALYGGGLLATQLAALRSVTLTGNTASGWGGGGYFVHGAVVTGAVVLNNQAADGGGLYFSNLSAQAWLTGSVLSGNTALSTTGTAGIVFGYMRAPTQAVDVLLNSNMTGPGGPASRGVQVGLGRSLALTGTTFSGQAVDVVSLGAQALRPTGYYTETAGSGLCGQPEVLTFTRAITVWYGSVSAGGVPVLALASASDRISPPVVSLAEGGGRPAALAGWLQPWSEYWSSSLDLVRGPSDGLDAEMNLRAALAGAQRPAGYGAVRFDSPTDRGAESVLLSNDVGFVECGDDLQLQVESHLVRVAFFELNAVAVRQLFLPLTLR